MKRSPGRARSHMTTKPVSDTLHKPFPVKARLSQTSSNVCPLFGKNDAFFLFSLLVLSTVVSLGFVASDGASSESSSSTGEEEERETEREEKRRGEGLRRRVWSHGRELKHRRPWLGIAVMVWYGNCWKTGGKEGFGFWLRIKGVFGIWETIGGYLRQIDGFFLRGFPFNRK